MSAFILNVPYTLIGLLAGLLSGIKSIKFDRYSQVFICEVKSFWWWSKFTRAMTIGHVILLGPKIEDNDLKHELVHIEQYKRVPLLFPFLYQIELFRRGYKNNKYEIEAYEKGGNEYKEN